MLRCRHEINLDVPSGTPSSGFYKIAAEEAKRIGDDYIPMDVVPG